MLTYDVILAPKWPDFDHFHKNIYNSVSFYFAGKPDPLGSATVSIFICGAKASEASQSAAIFNCANDIDVNKKKYGKNESEL